MWRTDFGQRLAALDADQSLPPAARARAGVRLLLASNIARPELVSFVQQAGAPGALPARVLTDADALQLTRRLEVAAAQLQVLHALW